MGTRTWGNTAMPPNNVQYRYDAVSSGVCYRADNLATATEDGYIDKIHVYGGPKNGTAHVWAALYNGTNGLLGAVDCGSFGAGYYRLTGTLSSYVHQPQGYTFCGAIFSQGQGLQTAGLGDGGSFHYATGLGSAPPDPYPGGSYQGGLGNLAWYVEYFPACKVTGIPSTPVPPGGTFTVSGLSFTAGVTGVSIGGVACPSWTVVSDTSLSVVAPPVGCQGPVQVTTKAGTGTSSGTLIVGTIWWGGAGGAVRSAVGVWYGDAGGTPRKVKDIWVPDGAGGVKAIW